MKIVLYVNSFLPNIGGRQFVVYYLARTLKDLGHDVRVLGPGGFWRHRKLRFGFPVHRWPQWRGSMKERGQIASLLLDTAVWGCDVVHAHNTYPTGYIAARAKSLVKLPLIVTPHGGDINVVPEIGRGLRLDSKINQKIEFGLREADVLTAISRNVETSLLDAGANKEIVHTIPNGVDLERFSRPPSVDVRARFGLAADTKLVLTVGNYGRYRGHEDLIAAMRSIATASPKSALVIVGGGTDVLQPLIKEYGLGGRVILTGRVAQTSYARLNGKGTEVDLLAEIYRASDVYVSAGIAEGAEGLSLALLDGMASTLPTVATDISGNRDVVRDGETGFLVPPRQPDVLADRIAALLENGPLRARLGAAARDAMQDFGWHAIAKRYVDVYHEARERCRARRA